MSTPSKGATSKSKRRRTAQTPERPARRPTPGYAARERACRAVDAVLRDGKYLRLDDDRSRPNARMLDPRDLALARKIAGTTLRRLGSLRAAVSACLSGPGLPQNTPLEAILLTGACQLLLLQTPAHSAVDIAVRLTASDPATRRYRGLVNAVLRTMTRRIEELIPEQVSPLDTPGWLYDRWTQAYGVECTGRILARHATEPPLDLAVKSDPALWAERLNGTLLPTGAVRLDGGGRINALEGYSEGAWWVQDVAAGLPARLFGDVSGRRIADLCAAPGGKTAQLASLGANVTAVDISAPRLKRLRTNLDRLSLSVEIIEADLLEWAPEVPFDAILLDAPCTATGTIRRHPEVAWLRSADDLKALADLQQQLIDRSLGMLRPGGTLVYVTCSLEPEEGEQHITSLLERRPDISRKPIDASEVGGLSEAITSDGDLRTLPCHLATDVDHYPDMIPGLDGFFAARLTLRH